MDMSPACMLPAYDRGTDTERAHPRWRDYMTYQSAMVRQMVRGCDFAAWLKSTEDYENGRLVVFDTLPGARLGPGWFVNEFRPNTRDPITHGPFPDEASAREFRPHA